MTLRQQVETWATLILVACAVILTGTFVWRTFALPSAGAASSAPEKVRDWEKYAVGSMQIGDQNADVVITEFSDFECPACLRLYHSLERMRNTNPGQVRIVYRNYPLSTLHPNARTAALGAECAASQQKFAEYYAYVFPRQDSLAGMDQLQVAARIGVPDTVAYRACLSSSAAAQRLKEDSVAAAELKIRGTPLVLINGLAYAGAPTDAVIQAAIDQKRSSSRIRD
ncbi:MAG: DsbA family protein [Gemmatimonadaceae bacterium]